jgi:hypothetical protein
MAKRGRKSKINGWASEMLDLFDEVKGEGARSGKIGMITRAAAMERLSFLDHEAGMSPLVAERLPEITRFHHAKKRAWELAKERGDDVTLVGAPVARLVGMETTIVDGSARGTEWAYALADSYLDPTALWHDGHSARDLRGLLASEHRRLTTHANGAAGSPEEPLIRNATRNVERAMEDMVSLDAIASAGGALAASAAASGSAAYSLVVFAEGGDFVTVG